MSFGFALVLLGLITGIGAFVQQRARHSLFLLLELGGVALLALTTWSATSGRREEKLHRLRVEAERDTQVNYLKGQLRVATRLVVQKNVELSLALRVPKARPVVAATVTQPVRDVPVELRLPASDTLRLAVDSAGLHLRVDVMPPPPEWRVSGHVWADSVPLTVAFHCQKDGAGRATVAGPTWASVALTDLQMDEGICNPKPSWSMISLKPPSLLWAGALITGTVLVIRFLR